MKTVLIVLPWLAGAGRSWSWLSGAHQARPVSACTLGSLVTLWRLAGRGNTHTPHSTLHTPAPVTEEHDRPRQTRPTARSVRVIRAF